MTASAEIVRYSLTDSVATITMDDGKVNSLSQAMLDQLSRAFDRAAADRAAVVLSGRPQRFSAGFDLDTLKAGGEVAHQMLLSGFRSAERILSFPLPVVAACTGHAIAMGAFLLLASDVRLGAAGAFKIGANEVAIGLTMPYSAIEIILQRVPMSHVTRAAITAEIYTPESAVAAGFLDHVVPADAVVAEAQERAKQLTGLHPVAFAETKHRVRGRALEALRDAIVKDDVALRGRF
jgi:enoyl-CoA hydratase